MQKPETEPSDQIKALLVSKWRGERQPTFGARSEALRGKIEVDLREQGVDEAIIQYMSAVNRARALLRPTPALARSLFPIERLPDGALPTYDGDPDVAGLILAGSINVGSK